MKKVERVKSNLLFNEIIAKKNKISNNFFSIYYDNADDSIIRFGISAPKKIGNAVIRNKLKRQMRHIIDSTKMIFKKNGNYIIIIKERCLHEKFEKKLESFKTLIGELNEK